MRTTLTIDDDVAALLAKTQKKRKASLKAVVNDALRQGLHQLDGPPPRQTRFRMKTWNMGPSLVGCLDNIEAVITAAEGERHK